MFNLTVNVFKLEMRCHDKEIFNLLSCLSNLQRWVKSHDQIVKIDVERFDCKRSQCLYRRQMKSKYWLDQCSARGKNCRIHERMKMCITRRPCVARRTCVTCRPRIVQANRALTRQIMRWRGTRRSCAVEVSCVVEANRALTRYVAIMRCRGESCAVEAYLALTRWIKRWWDVTASDVETASNVTKFVKV